MTASASMAQVNVRMSPELKAAGEAAMSAYGFTPTEVLRWVYQTFAEGREGISHLLREGSEARRVPVAQDAPDDRGAALLRDIDDRYRSFCQSLGLDASTLPQQIDDTYEELDRAYWNERDRERKLGDYAE